MHMCLESKFPTDFEFHRFTTVKRPNHDDQRDNNASGNSGSLGVTEEIVLSVITDCTLF